MDGLDGRTDGRDDGSIERKKSRTENLSRSYHYSCQVTKRREGEGGKETVSICACAWAGRKRKEEKSPHPGKTLLLLLLLSKKTYKLFAPYWFFLNSHVILMAL